MDIKPIRVSSEEQFERLCDRIDREVSFARHHWTLLRAIENAHPEYWREMNESTTFWYLTLIAHQDEVLSSLGRLYDDTNGALSLIRFLETVRANHSFFSKEAYEARMEGRVHAERDRNVAADVDPDLQTVSESDPLVKELRCLRHKAIAHTDADAVRRDAAAAHKRSLPPEHIEELLTRATNITSKYSLHFRSSTFGGIAGADDFMNTLRWVRKGLSVHDAEIEEQLKHVRGTDGGGEKQ
jgi:hypothetical protein